MFPQRLAAGKFRLVARDIDLRELMLSRPAFRGDRRRPQSGDPRRPGDPDSARPIFAGEPIPPHLQDWVDRWETTYWLAREAAGET
ncbi:MAG: hypothetical protein R3F11_29640 [Verrucomicrobiales bacterium]